MVQNLPFACILTFSAARPSVVHRFMFHRSVRVKYEVFAEIMATTLPLQHLKSKDLYAFIPGIGFKSTGI